MQRTARLLACSAAVVWVVGACSSKSSHPGAVGECGPGVDCTGIIPPGGGGGDAQPDAPADVADADASSTTLSFDGEVHSSSSFTQDPSLAPLDTRDTGFFVRTSIAGTVSDVAVVAGQFKMTNVNARRDLTLFTLGPRDAATGGLTARTLYYLPFDGTFSTIAKPVPIPLFDAALPQVAAGQVGLTLPTIDKATIVLQLVDSTGAGVPGIVAAISGADAGTSAACNATNPCGPYYDDNDFVTSRATGTGPRGTVVFLAVPRDFPFGYDLTLGGKPLVQISALAAQPNVVSFLRAQVAK